MAAVLKYYLAFCKGKFIPVHATKTYRKSRGTAPLTLTLALEIYITSYVKNCL
jgi:hypothetical protein